MALTLARNLGRVDRVSSKSIALMNETRPRNHGRDRRYCRHLAQIRFCPDPQGLATINDDDSLRSLSIDDPTINEDDLGGTMTFTVSLSSISASVVTVGYVTANGTGANPAQEPDDYTATSGTLTFDPG